MYCNLHEASLLVLVDWWMVVVEVAGVCWVCVEEITCPQPQPPEDPEDQYQSDNFHHSSHPFLPCLLFPICLYHFLTNIKGVSRANFMNEYVYSFEEVNSRIIVL